MTEGSPSQSTNTVLVLQAQRIELPEVLDDLNEFVAAVALAAGVLHEFSCASDNGAPLGCARHGDAPAASELQQTLVAKDAQRPQDGVRVHAELGGEIACGWEALAGLGFAVSDSSPDLGSDLAVEVEGIAQIELDIAHDDSHSSFIVTRAQP